MYWFTAKPAYNEVITSLDDSNKKIRSHLYRLGVLKSVNAGVVRTSEFPQVLAHPKERKWHPIESASMIIGAGKPIRLGEYHKLKACLNELEALLPYATLADEMSLQAPRIDVNPMNKQESTDIDSLEGQLRMLLDRFTYSTTTTTSAGETRVAGKQRRLGKMDEYGRVFAKGKRKEASAVVWIVPVQSAWPSTDQEQVAQNPVGQVIVNNRPIETFFSYDVTRKAALRAFEYTDTMGVFNVFAIANGGGVSSQADAVAMATARALVEWERQALESQNQDLEDSEWRPILNKAKLLTRDPRMVERKKTGQVKARKKWTWVKR